METAYLNITTPEGGNHMTVTGFINPTHILRCFLEHEYAFEVAYPKHAVRIAHAKGAWRMVKIAEGKAMDSITVQDCSAGWESDNEMTKALYGEMDRIHMPKTDGGWRRSDAFVIEMFLRIWGGKPDGVEYVAAVQPGRNAWVDEDTGEFSLRPREEEFHK